MRYVAVNDSGHPCCFRYAVRDTRDDSTVCECYDLEEADKICRALNALDAAEEA